MLPDELTAFYKGKKVLVTGHTGFKGAWLSQYLYILGASVCGCALPWDENSLYSQIAIQDKIDSNIVDIRDYRSTETLMNRIKPEIIIHLAAFSFIKKCYEYPIKAYETNAIGTANLLQIATSCDSVKAIVVVTSDKVYLNLENKKGYKETAHLGGIDPYSASKVCQDIIALSYMNNCQNTFIATARPSNVLGGGDHQLSRLIPSMLEALSAGRDIVIRNPNAIRPWQYVLDALTGYLLLAMRLYTNGNDFTGSWNFGPYEGNIRDVYYITEAVCHLWGNGGRFRVENDNNQKIIETNILQLNINKALSQLGWKPIYTLEETLRKTVEFKKKQTSMCVSDICNEEISEYLESVRRNANAFH